uniref:Uncharacterized protein n=1 Tax=Anguilla anguilla TaxID=7936 RepID=A0A0E9ST44_ANGAN
MSTHLYIIVYFTTTLSQGCLKICLNSNFVIRYTISALGVCVCVYYNRVNLGMALFSVLALILICCVPWKCW